MAAPLVALSIVCTIFLAVFLPVRRIYSSIPCMALLLWLLLANIIRAVNSVVWNGNVDIISPVWCDITTKIVLGVNVAIPSAILCIGRQLEHASSSRKILTDPRVQRNSKMFEVTCCYFIPLIYMALHIISQDSRFDLVEDFGCSASIHPSTPALITIWTLPLVLSAIAMFLCGLAIHHSFKMSTLALHDHVSSRTSMSSSLFFRRLTTAMVLLGVCTVGNLFSLFSIPILKEWTSWDDVHANLGQVRIPVHSDEIGNVRLSWWTLFTISIIYIVLALFIGEETRDSYRWLVRQYGKRDEYSKRLKPLVMAIPLRGSKDAIPGAAISKSRSRSSVQGPHMIDLKSGWDDMLELKYPRSPNSAKTTRSLNYSPPASPSSSRSPSAASMRENLPPLKTKTRAMSSEDAAFMNSTVSYLGSPPAKALGVSPLSQAPPPPMVNYHLPRKPAPVLSLVIADPVLPAADLALCSPAVRSPTPANPPPHITSVFDARWPIPPTTPSPPTSVHASRYDTRSPTHSLASSISDVHSYYRGRPFENSSVPTSPQGRVVDLPDDVSKTPSLKRSLQNLKVRGWDRVRHPSSSSLSGYPEGIHMSVVHEVV